MMEQRSRILVTGAGGQLGKELQQLAPHWPQFEFLFADRERMPVDQEETVRKVFESFRPEYCINCAAYTAVDKAESEPDLAYRVNAEGVRLLASACRQAGCRLVHISTDYVFDGTAGRPYSEEDPANPVSVYGASKKKGEDFAQQADPSVIIIRTSWVYSEYGKNFVKTMLRLMREKESIHVVDDQYGAPTYAADLAEAILQIIASGKWVPGIYHFSNEGRINWFAFAEAIRELSKSNCRIHPIPAAQYPTPARRPAWSVFDTSKIQNT